MADLRPVAPLRPPWLLALGWTAMIAALAVVFMVWPGSGAIGRSVRPLGDMWLAELGSILTMFTAAWAAFQTGVPGSDRRWAYLPLPSLALWIGASGAGCLRGWLLSPAVAPSAVDEVDCLTFIVAVALPVSLLLFLMLRRAMPLRPELTAILGGLASAAAAATLLSLFHPADAALSDLAVHAGAVLAIVIAAQRFGGRYLAGRTA